MDLRAIVGFVLTSAGVLVIATLLDRPLWQALLPVDPRIGTAGWAQALRALGYLPFWIVVSMALLLVDWRPRPATFQAVSRASFLACSVLAAGGLGELLKMLIRRLRPELTGGEYVFRPFFEDPLSTSGLGMPSGHAMVAFAAAWALCRLWPAASIVWIAAALGCAGTRLLDHAHFASDTVLSAVLAFAVVRCVWCCNRHLDHNSRVRAAAMSSQECNLCGSRTHEIVSRLSRYLLPLETVMCTSCGLVFSNPVPSPEALRAFYSKRYRLLYQGVLGESPPRRHVLRRQRAARRALDFLQNHLPAEEPGILEIGCGSGEFLALCRERGLAAAGIEPGQHYARHARDELGLSVSTTTLDDFDAAPGAASLVVMMEVLEHLPDPSAALSKINRILTPGGKLFVTVPNVLNPELPPISRFHFAHIYNYSPATLEMMMRKAGFEPVDPHRRCTMNLFKKVRSPSDQMEIPANAVAEIRSFFTEHSARKYLFSWPTYRLFFVNLFSMARDRL